MDKTDKPLSEWTVGMVKKLCLERCDCVGCPAYIQDKCVFWKCDNPQAWNVNMTGTDITRKFDSSEKPRLAQVLGMEVGERFKVLCNGMEYDCVIGQDGAPGGTAWEVIYAINHPESIIRLPRLTEPEIAIMRATGAKWVSRDKHGDSKVNFVRLWDEKPKKFENVNGWIFEPSAGDHALAVVYTSLFPSVHPGDCIELEDAQ